MKITTEDEILKYCNEFCELNELTDGLSVIECAMKHRDCPIRNLELHHFILIQNMKYKSSNSK